MLLCYLSGIFPVSGRHGGVCLWVWSILAAICWRIISWYSLEIRQERFLFVSMRILKLWSKNQTFCDVAANVFRHWVRLCMHAWNCVPWKRMCFAPIPSMREFHGTSPEIHNLPEVTSRLISKLYRLTSRLDVMSLPVDCVFQARYHETFA